MRHKFVLELLPHFWDDNDWRITSEKNGEVDSDPVNFPPKPPKFDLGGLDFFELLQSKKLTLITGSKVKRY